MAINTQTEVVKSVSISALCGRRDVMLAEFGNLLKQIQRLDELGTQEGIHLGRFESWFCDERSRADLAVRSKDPIEFIRKRIDRSGWQLLMQESGLTTYMDAKARQEWREGLEKDVPPLTIENVESTFWRLHECRLDLRDRGIIELFRRLSWNYKTHLPQKLTHKLILEYVVSIWSGGFSMGYADRSDQINDLDRVLRLLDGKPELDYRDSVADQMRRAVNDRANRTQTLETEYLDLKWFKKGTCHVLIKRRDLVDQLNDIIAKHYPDALPELRAA